MLQMSDLSHLPDLDDALCERSGVLSAQTKVLLGKMIELRRCDEHAIEALWAVACYINILEQDILAFGYFPATTEDTWSRNASKRALATVIYEGIDDLQILFGKANLEAGKAAGIRGTFEQTLKAATKSLHTFRRVHEPALKKIRMRTLAHRDHDIWEFILAACETDTETIILVAAELRKVLNGLRSVSEQLIALATESLNDKNRTSGPVE